MILPVVAIVMIRINTIEQHILKQMKGYTKTSGSSAATILNVKLHLIFRSVDVHANPMYITVYMALTQINAGIPQKFKNTIP